METISLDITSIGNNIVIFEKPIKVLSFQVASNFEQVLNAPIFNYYPDYEEVNEGEVAKITQIISDQVADYNANKITQFDYITVELNKQQTNHNFKDSFLSSGVYKVSVYNKNTIDVKRVFNTLNIKVFNDSNQRINATILFNYEFI